MSPLYGSGEVGLDGESVKQERVKRQYRQWSKGIRRRKACQRSISEERKYGEESTRQCEGTRSGQKRHEAARRLTTPESARELDKETSDKTKQNKRISCEGMRDEKEAGK
jgi:hypothetical protein